MWWLVVWWENTFGDWSKSRFWEYKGYRKARGGKWGLWETTAMGDTFRMWCSSACDHYPRPFFANSTEPLEVEDYSLGKRI